VNDLPRLFAHSIDVIRANQAPSGAYLAAPTFRTYHYSWFRDGAFIADAMSRVGEVVSADAFHGWCTQVLLDRRERVERLVAKAAAGEPVLDDEHLHTRYTLDGRESDEPWENFQLDGYGTWLWALDQHRRRHDGVVTPHLAAVEVAVRYLTTFWDGPSYDWWEEHRDHRHTSTLGAIFAGLGAVATWDELASPVRQAAAEAAERIRVTVEREATRAGSLTKWLGSDAVDASLAACIVPFQLVDPSGPVAEATLRRIEAELTDGGVHRYLDDVYYGGGQWVLLAGFLGWAHAARGDRDRAGELLTWMTDQARPSGDLPEQVATVLLHPDHEQPWIDRWGPSACPLLWSHAMLLVLADTLVEPAPSAFPLDAAAGEAAS
jgi:isomaltose glucohydrolase